MSSELLLHIAVGTTPVVCFLATLVYLVGALGYGLLVSSVARTQAMAFQVGVLTSMLPAIFLSGFIFPIGSMPIVLQYVTTIVPARYFLVALRGIVLKGSELHTLWQPIAALAAIRDGKSFAGVVDILGEPYFTSYEPMRAQNGEVIVPGSPNTSTLVAVVQGTAAPEVRMPHEGQKLTRNRIENIVLWIRAGAPQG